MKKIIVVFLCFFTLIGFSSNLYWGKTGHRATAEIAEGYLTKRAKRNIEKLLNGKSLALVSTYGDDIKSDPSYKEYSSWHYINIPEGKSYQEVANQLGNNLVQALGKCISALKDEHTPKNKKQFYLKMLVHLMGDLHQPLHVGHADDRGGNNIKLTWFDEETNLHKVWDSDMIDFYKMSYTELAHNQTLLSKDELKVIQKGSIVDWMNESKQLAKKVYASATANDNLRYGYMYDWFPQVRKQLQKGGIRLAKVLNDIFS